MSQGGPIITVTLNPAIDQTLTIPGFAAGQVNRVASAESHPAGKGVNVAVVLADLGADTAATGLLGDRNADGFERLLRDKGIADHFVRVPGETRIGIKIVEPGSGQTTDVNFPGLTPSPQAVEDLCRRVEALAGPDRWFVLCGSVPVGLQPGIYARLIDLIRARGGRVVLDTSGVPLREALRRGPDAAKPNVAELAEHAGRSHDQPQDVADAARSLLLGQGVRLAVVSMGGDGAVFVDPDRALVARPPRVSVRSTVGAGDAMVAGIVFALDRGLPLEQCAGLASALGAHAVTRVRAGLDAPGAHEAYLPDITIEPLGG
jgi:1-phosphofructokinase